MRHTIIEVCNQKIAFKGSDVGLSFYAFFENKNTHPEVSMEVSQWCIMTHKLNHFEKSFQNKIHGRTTLEPCFMESQKNNPLHGVKLEQIITELEAHYGWEYMGNTIPIRCFTDNPSIKSSLKFLRRTPWARDKVEVMYLKMLQYKR